MCNLSKLVRSMVVVLCLQPLLPAQASLQIDSIYEGVTATFQVNSGTANANLHLCYSHTGFGPTSLPNHGIVLDLSAPIQQLSPFQLDSNGQGTFGPVAVPNSLVVGTKIWVQGVESAGSLLSVSNMVPVVIEQMPTPPHSDMMWVEGGIFDMGDHFAVGDSDEIPVHKVLLDNFFIDSFELTNKKYVDYLNAEYAAGSIAYLSSWGIVYQVGGSGKDLSETYDAGNGSGFNWNGSKFFSMIGESNIPVVCVSWYGACHFANWLSQQDGLTPCYDETTWDCDFTANGYRLPTEAEWEFAARGGADNPYHQFPWNLNLASGSDASYWDNGYNNHKSVGSYSQNGYGLYDTAGNVYEWCNDWYDSGYYANSPVTNPTGPSSSSAGFKKVVRGGHYLSQATDIRSANRLGQSPYTMASLYGFRLMASRP